jgi:hypothetical protein
MPKGNINELILKEPVGPSRDGDKVKASGIGFRTLETGSN